MPYRAPVHHVRQHQVPQIVKPLGTCKYVCMMDAWNYDCSAAAQFATSRMTCGFHENTVCQREESASVRVDQKMRPRNVPKTGCADALPC